ncbi:MAG TPA: protein translocase subunit SecD [Pyrinomonadaceae bacterium]|nr:protein translocase subunit SecD [Pyrinomonadaceae bacterium]
MKKNLLQRVIIIAIVTIAALWVVVGPRHRPNAKDFTLAGINNTLRENIRLGLDLRGGSHLVMQVKVEDYLKRVTEAVASGVQTAARAQNYNIKEVRPEIAGDNYRVILEANDASKLSEMRNELPRRVNDFDPTAWSSNVDGNRIVWEMTSAAKTSLGDRATADALRIIDTRLNAIGVAEPLLQEHGAKGSHQILLQMPGIQDPERIKKLITGESRLELMKVISPPNPSPMQVYASEEEAKRSVAGKSPSSYRVLPYSERDEPAAAGTGPTPAPDPNRPKQWVVVENPAVVDGSELREASAGTQGGVGEEYLINFALKPTGAQKFGTWTAANIGQYMAVVLNDEVKSAPFIKGQINDSGQITGNFTKESANDLALTLRSGALPAKLVYQEERTVGPSLGADSIRSGVTASLVGLLLVILFMVFYYRGSGINAVVALLLNMIMTLAALVIFDATLTLPGIAGIILSIGMAVDSNVLIFERIREELRTGKTVASSVDQGFARAFTTIIDTHVTTIVAALFLFVFGTGPIRGFAVTLVLSLLANLFSAVYVSRTIFIWVLNRRGRRAETLSI